MDRYYEQSIDSMSRSTKTRPKKENVKPTTKRRNIQSTSDSDDDGAETKKQKKHIKSITTKTKQEHTYRPSHNLHFEGPIVVKLTGKMFGSHSKSNETHPPTPVDQTDEDPTLDRSFPEDEKDIEQYIDDTIQRIRRLDWNEQLMFYNGASDGVHMKRCSVHRNVRFNYIFRGCGSKNLAKEFITQTIDDTNFGYTQLVQIMDDLGYRQYIPIRNWQEMWSRYRNEPLEQRFLFEIIGSERPCKPYLDIEWLIDDALTVADYTLELGGWSASPDAVIGSTLRTFQSQYSKKLDRWVDRLVQAVVDIFKTRYELIISRDDVLLLSSHSTKKVSFHLVVDAAIDGQQLVFHTNRAGFDDSAVDLCNALIEQHSEYADALDRSVYTTDREFRTIYSTKPGEVRPLVPYRNTQHTPSHKLLDTKTCLRYLVTHVDTNQRIIRTSLHHQDRPIQSPGVKTCKSECAEIIRSERRYDPIKHTRRLVVVAKSASTFDAKIERIIELAKTVHRSSIYTGPATSGHGWRFTYSDRTEPCYTGRCHESNGFYIFNDECSIYMQCTSRHCKSQRHKLEKQRLTKNLFNHTLR